MKEYASESTLIVSVIKEQNVSNARINSLFSRITVLSRMNTALITVKMESSALSVLKIIILTVTVNANLMNLGVSTVMEFVHPVNLHSNTILQVICVRFLTVFRPISQVV